MKKAVALLAALATFAAYADDTSTSAETPTQSTNTVVVTTARADGTTNTWTQTDLQDALGLMNRKYWRDMATEQGRRSWHGSIVASYVTTNTAGVLTNVRVYDDGYVHREEGRRRVAIADPEAAARAAAEREARLRELEARTLPPDVAAILAARRAAATTNTVTVTITP